MTGRREFIKAGAALSLLSGRREAEAAPPPAPLAADRLDQGPFGIEQDEGWYTVATTTPSSAPLRNFGTGLVGYTWEENEPSPCGSASAPGECERRSAPALRGRAHPVRLARRAVLRRLDLRCERSRSMPRRPRTARRLPRQLRTRDQPDRLALPDFLQAKVLTSPAPRGGRLAQARRAPLDVPGSSAPSPLVDLQPRETDGKEIFEFADLMPASGARGTSDWANPPRSRHRGATFLGMTRRQTAAWKRRPGREHAARHQRRETRRAGGGDPGRLLAALRTSSSTGRSGRAASGRRRGWRW